MEELNSSTSIRWLFTIYFLQSFYLGIGHSEGQGHTPRSAWSQSTEFADTTVLATGDYDNNDNTDDAVQYILVPEGCSYFTIKSIPLKKVWYFLEETDVKGIAFFHSSFET